MGGGCSAIVFLSSQTANSKGNVAPLFAIIGFAVCQLTLSRISVRQMAAEIAILLARSFSFFDLRQQRKNYRKKKKLEVKGKSVESTWLIRN